MNINRKGFTLIELLIVIGIIAILASGVIVAINPGRQFAQARDASRESHINTLHKALISYQVDNQGNLSGLSLPSTPTEICNTNLDTPDCSTDSLVDLSDLVDNGYINSLPVDPQGSVSTASDGTGYFVAEGSIILVAENAETRFIGIGITESEYTAGEQGSFGRSDVENSSGSSGFAFKDGSGQEVFYQTGTCYTLEEKARIESISFYLDKSETVGMKAALYDCDTLSLIMDSVTGTSGSVDGWNTLSLTNDLVLEPGNYLIAVIGDASDLVNTDGSVDSAGMFPREDVGGDNVGFWEDVGSYNFKNDITLNQSHEFFFYADYITVN